MKEKKRKKVAPKTSRAAVTLQAGQNEAKAITQADAGTQTEEESDQLQEEEQEQMAAKLFGLDEGDTPDSAADDSGWEDDDDDEDDDFLL